MRTKLFGLMAVAVCGLVAGQSAQAVTNLGTGTGALIGNDLTDLGDDGVKGSYNLHTGGSNAAGFDAVFFSSDEPGFNGGEFAFNVFSNDVGGGNNKWCCGTSFPQIVGADFSNTLATDDKGIVLQAFTVTSGNDTVGRDPISWRIEGSNDTTDGMDGTWETIYDSPTQTSDWAARNQVNLYSPLDGDVFQSTDPYKAFRMVTDSTGLTGGAFFQINEIEFFGEVVSAVPEPASIALLGMGAFGLIRRRRRVA